MKVLLFVFGIILMVGCCSTKISTQYVTSGIILMPDYTSLITEGNYCCIDTLIQTPSPKTYLTPKDIGEVTIIGYDCYGNFKVMEFKMKPLDF